MHTPATAATVSAAATTTAAATSAEQNSSRSITLSATATSAATAAGAAAAAAAAALSRCCCLPLIRRPLYFLDMHAASCAYICLFCVYFRLFSLPVLCILIYISSLSPSTH